MPDYAGVRFPGRNDIRRERQKSRQKHRTFENSENTACLISANNKRADIIYQNFLGQTFDGEMEDDDGFAYAYMNNSLNEYMTYWKNTEERSLTFEKDGSVYYNVY